MGTPIQERHLWISTQNLWIWMGNFISTASLEINKPTYDTEAMSTAEINRLLWLSDITDRQTQTGHFVNSTAQLAHKADQVSLVVYNKKHAINSSGGARHWLRGTLKCCSVPSEPWKKDWSQIRGHLIVSAVKLRKQCIWTAPAFRPPFYRGSFASGLSPRLPGYSL